MTRLSEKQPHGSLAGQVILITGGTSGLGAVSAVALARLGPTRIYISGRRSSAAESVAQQIRAVSPSTDVRFLYCDLADLSLVRSAALRVLDQESRLDVLMANAGVAAVPPGVTLNGYEVHFGVNHIGHALLIRKLLPLLSVAGGRVVSVTSFLFRAAWWGIPFDQVKPGVEAADEAEWFTAKRWLRYAESKLANIVYMKELVRRYPDIKSLSVSPGFVDTEMVAGMRWCDRLGTRIMSHVGGGMVTPEDGALNQIWAATAGRGELVDGAVYEPVAKLCENPGSWATDAKLGEQLWEWTEKELESWL